MLMISPFVSIELSGITLTFIEILSLGNTVMYYYEDTFFNLS